LSKNPEPEIFALSLVELSQRLHNRDLSPVELMEHVYERMEAAREPLNAITQIRDRDEAMADARRAEERLAAGGGGPLEGIPLGVKDLEDVKGMVTSMGSKLFLDQVAMRDATQVSRLKASGAIPVAKTNTPEFGFTAITKNLPFGTTRSPWNRDYTPGGSSGGSAACLAGGILPLVTASDGGGSIRIPASFVGAFGLKTTYGRVPRGPRKSWENGDTSVYGPLTKTVDDAALMLDQVVGVSPCDPNSLPHPGLSYVEELKKPLDDKLRLGFSPDLGGAAVVSSEIAVAVEDAVRVFESLGHRLETIEGGPPNLGSVWSLVGNFELAGQLDEQLESRRDDITRALVRGLDEASIVTPKLWGDISRKREQLNQWCWQIFERYDALLTPTVPFDPPPAGGPFPTEIEGRELPPAAVAAFTIPFNFSWHPAATVRIGVSRAGLPMGLQIVGARHREDLVLRIAKAFEQQRPWHPHWPIMS
jgi:aspartyl-tRNA(Asn)/glutamyl-tRNA(Gln) amidotransferase subunit A